MPADLVQQFAAVARRHTHGRSVFIEIPLIRIDGQIHPCDVSFHLDCSPIPEPLSDAETCRLLEVAAVIQKNGEITLTPAELELFTRAGYDLSRQNLISVAEAILKPADDS